MALKTGELGIKLIEEFEQINDGDNSRIGFQPKLDCSGIFTAGIGHAIVDPITKKFITIDTPGGYTRACELYKDLSIEEVEKLFQKDLKKYENFVRDNLKIELKQNEFDALVSHVFNCGISETLFGLINKYPHYIKSIRDFWLNHYIKSDGIIRNGLIRRRKSEYELFLNGKLNFFENE